MIIVFAVRHPHFGLLPCKRERYLLCITVVRGPDSTMDVMMTSIELNKETMEGERKKVNMAVCVCVCVRGQSE